jgi:hypothetical protein
MSCVSRPIRTPSPDGYLLVESSLDFAPLRFIIRRYESYRLAALAHATRAAHAVRE